MIDSVTKYFLYLTSLSHGRGYYGLITVTRVQGITKTVHLFSAAFYLKKKGSTTSYQTNDTLACSLKPESSFTKD